jgi:hypothetical protein
VLLLLPLLAVAHAADDPLTLSQYQGDSVARPSTPWFASDPEGVGVGVILGLPTGLSVSWRRDTPLWFDGAVAWSFETETFALHVDGLLDVATPTAYGNPDWRFPIYVGAGLRIRAGEGAVDEGLNRAIVGVRIPVGMVFQHVGFPVEGFVELVPGVGIVPNTVGIFDIGVGFRIYLPRPDAGG